jgi:hypothetical protein
MLVASKSVKYLSIDFNRTVLTMLRLVSRLLTRTLVKVACDVGNDHLSIPDGKENDIDDVNTC